MKTFFATGFASFAKSSSASLRCSRSAALVLLGGAQLCMGSIGLAQSGPSRDTPDQPSTPEAATITVIGTTPLPGVGLPKAQIPANVQTATGAELNQSNSIDLADFMNKRLGSVHVNEMQGNPFQPDVNYRGYSASPLLGTPQGLSVYMDGVRMNQPFGDVMSWDLIPRSAISSITLTPGSNPIFGLNTLGGALSIQTKDGRSNPGSVLQTYVGSYGRRALELEHGGFNDQGLSWYGTANLFKDRGWREESPSDIRQLFGKLGWRDAKTDLKLSAAIANNQLLGNGLQEAQLLSSGYSSVYTKPDITSNKSMLLNLAAQHSLRDDLVFSGNMYYRSLKTRTLNGDSNEESLGQSVYQPSAADQSALAAAGYSGFPTAGANASSTPFPFWRCIAQALQNDEPAEKCNGLITRSDSKQTNYGISGQLTSYSPLAGRKNQLTVGAALDESRIRFNQLGELGYLNPDRSVTGVGAFGDGATGGEIDGAAFDTRVSLTGKVRTYSLFATDTMALPNQLNLTVSGRFNRTSVINNDLINPGGGLNSLDGNHNFSRFNPAIGLTWVPSRSLNTYLGLNQGSRAPTSIELGCANPERPCKLPNSMAGDPPLNQVITRTLEAGVRGSVSNNLSWSIGAFRAVSNDDILFVADDQSGFGYFKNFGKTRRQGLELGLNGRNGPLSFGMNHTMLQATYQSSDTVQGSSNSSNQGEEPGLQGNTNIKPGDRIPLIPQHLFKAYSDYRLTSTFSIGLNMVAVSSAFARGNENNQHRPDGSYYLGPGKSPGYAVFNLGARYQVEKQLQLFAQINNLFDRKYSTAALLGPSAFSGNGNFQARPFAAVNGEFPLQHSTFFAPGAPRIIWVGLRYHFEKPTSN